MVETFTLFSSHVFVGIENIVSMGTSGYSLFQYPSFYGLVYLLSLLATVFACGGKKVYLELY